MESKISRGFWQFGHDCKWDQLLEPQHTHLIYEALRDKETSIEPHKDGTYTLFGHKEALLVKPQLLVTKLLLSFYTAVCFNSLAPVID